MALTEYKQGTTFPGVIGRTVAESSPAWPEPLRAKEGVPKVLFIVLDDMGFGIPSAFGGCADMSTTDRLAENGLCYKQFHTVRL